MGTQTEEPESLALRTRIVLAGAEGKTKQVVAIGLGWDPANGAQK